MEIHNRGEKMEMKDIIKKGETQRMEFKVNSDNVGEDICAFANTNDGIILIGVNDDKNIAGVKNIKRAEEEIANIAHSCDPPARVIINKKKDVLIVKVKKSDMIHSFKSIVYIRVGSTDKPLSMHEVLELGHKLGKIEFDSQICERATLKDINKEKVKWYLEQREKSRNISKEIKISIKKLEQNIGAAVENKPTNSGILFFGEYPQKFLPNARLRVVKFKGTKVTHPTLDTANCEGTIWEMINTAEDFIRKNIRLLGVRTEKSFRREDKFEYPIKALREAIINALIHRNYFERGDVRVFIFDNRIEIINPGSFPEGVTPRNPKHKPVNENLCQLVYDTGFIEKYGSGIYMMKSLCKKWGNKEPYYELHPVETKITFESPIKEPTFVEIETRLSNRQKKAIEYVKKKGAITNREYREINYVSNRVAFEELSDLIEKEILVKKGGGRSVCYVFR